MFPDIVMHQSGDNEWTGISREPAETGEALRLDVVLFDRDPLKVLHRLSVCVVDCRPVMVGGDLRYRIRMQEGIVAPLLFEQQVRRG